MGKIINIKYFLIKNFRSAMPGIIFSLLLAIVVIATGLIMNLDMVKGAAALAVAQLGITLLWLLIRSGIFSTSGYGSRRYLKSSIEKNKEKIGVYSYEKKIPKNKIKDYDTSATLEKENQDKSKTSIYAMFIVGVVELIVALIINFI